MGYNTSYRGAISIDPPLTWAEIKDSPWLPETAERTWPDVKLRVTEQAVETDDGTLVRRSADILSSPICRWPKAVILPCRLVRIF